MRLVLLSALIAASSLGGAGCSDESSMTRVAKPEPSSLVSKWVPLPRPSGVAAMRSRLIGANPPAAASLELLSNRSCLPGPDMLAFMARCNDHSSPLSGPIACNWEVEESEVLVLATPAAGGSPFVWLRLGAYRESTEQQLWLSGHCRDGRQYTLAQAKS